MALDLGQTTWLAVAALAVAVLALVVSGVAVLRSRTSRLLRRPPARQRSSIATRMSRRRATAPSAPPSLEQLRDDLEGLRIEVSDALRHLAVVRYDAFGDMGGHLSWSMALLDDGGNGVVLTSIHGRSDARTYAKNIRVWTCDQQLSPEEQDAIDYARGQLAG